MRAAQGGAAEGGAAEGDAAEEPTALLSMELSPAIAMFFKRHKVESNAEVVKILSDLGAKTVVDLTFLGKSATLELEANMKELDFKRLTSAIDDLKARQEEVRGSRAFLQSRS